MYPKSRRAGLRSEATPRIRWYEPDAVSLQAARAGRMMF